MGHQPQSAEQTDPASAVGSCPELSVHTAFHHEPFGNRLFAVLMGGLLPASLLAFVVWLSIGSEVPIWNTVLVLVVISGLAFGISAFVIPNFVLRRTVALGSDRVHYHDLWSMVSIRWSNVRAAYSAIKRGRLYVFVWSNAGAMVGLGDGFQRKDKEVVWQALQEKLAPLGIPMEEGLTESDMFKRLAEVQWDPDAGEDVSHLHTRVLTVLGLGAILLPLFAGLGFLFIVIVERGEILWLVLFLVLGTALLLVLAGLLADKDRILGSGLVLLAIGMVVLAVMLAIAMIESGPSVGQLALVTFLTVLSTLPFFLGRNLMKSTSREST